MEIGWQHPEFFPGGPQPNTNRALRPLTSEVGRDPVHSTRYGRQRFRFPYMWVETYCKHACCVVVLCRLAHMWCFGKHCKQENTHNDKERHAEIVQRHSNSQNNNIHKCNMKYTSHQHQGITTHADRPRRRTGRGKEANGNRLAAPWGLPGRSPTPVLTGPCAASLRRSEEIRCSRRGMAASDAYFLTWLVVPLQACLLCGSSMQIGTSR